MQVVLNILFPTGALNYWDGSSTIKMTTRYLVLVLAIFLSGCVTAKEAQRRVDAAKREQHDSSWNVCKLQCSDHREQLSMFWKKEICRMILGYEMKLLSYTRAKVIKMPKACEPFMEKPKHADKPVLPR